VLLHGVALLVQGCACAPPLGFGDSLCGVAGPDCAPVALVPDCAPVALEAPVALLGVALSCALDGVAGVDGVVVVVWVVCVVVLLLAGCWLFWPELLVLLWEPMLAPDWLLVVSVLVLCASASVPVKSRPAARIDNFFMV
jgi:hypothetical protein